jgi:hypothetical protein
MIYATLGLSGRDGLVDTKARPTPSVTPRLRADFSQPGTLRPLAGNPGKLVNRDLVQMIRHHCNSIQSNRIEKYACQVLIAASQPDQKVSLQYIQKV